MTWNITWTYEQTETELLSAFDKREQLIELRGTILRDVFRVFLAGKFRGIVVGTTETLLTEAVRKLLGADADL